ncbi:MAG: translation elongation factor Ts, partial [Bdellovibrionales bacterium]|nr:translation elongation factor Ts [Bdellovibrionales bacterium]
MSITAKTVSELRERTGAGMMDCKKALTENSGDLEKATEWLRKKGLSAAAKKTGRVAAEGLVSAWTSPDLKTAVILEVNSETDFVARNDKFQALVKNVTAHIATNKPKDMATLLTQKYQGGGTVQDALTTEIATIGENLVLRRFELIDLTGTKGGVISYLHGEGRIGVLVELTAQNDATAKAPQFAELAKDIAMHVAAMNPACARAEELNSALVEKEREILTGKARESGKKEEMIPKIVEGQLSKWKAEVVLIDQAFVPGD